VVEATDDATGEHYPVDWPDMTWRRGRTTTRLVRRPPAEATRLHFTIRPIEPPPDPHLDFRPYSSSLPPVAEFDVDLPVGHHLPWGELPDWDASP
jgi:hypothetical protein